MTSEDRTPILGELTDELLVVSTLLAMISQPSDKAQTMLDMCSASVERCQNHVVTLLRGEGRVS